MLFGRSIDELINEIKELDHAISSNWEVIQKINYYNSRYPKWNNKPLPLRIVEMEYGVSSQLRRLLCDLEIYTRSLTFDDGNDDNSDKVTISKYYNKSISDGLNIVIHSVKDDYASGEYISFNKQWSYDFWEHNCEAKIPDDDDLERMAEAMYSSMMEEKEQPPTISWKTLLMKLNS